jgi:TonB-dependent SusC/RagA subfamily outer membrane receptor
MKKNLLANSPGKGRWLNLLLKMKLTLVILLLGLVQASASVYSQASKISLDVSGKQVIKVLKEIEENTEFRFFFQDEQVDVERLVSVKVSDKTIDDVLKEIFKNQQVSYKIINDKMILLTSEDGQNQYLGGQPQQKIKVTGKVTNSEGDPLPGVTIVVPGTNNGVITNENGEYSIINVPADGVLSFSFVGMEKQDIHVNGRNVVNVLMESSVESIQEVVAVGYGTQKAKNVTGSIVNIPVDQIKDLPVSNLAESLKGQIPGLSVTGGSKRPGESATLQVRQTFSFSKDGGSDVPLIVIDDMIRVDPQTGLPSLDEFNRLDPSEIESITVLKDGSAAIYGARASQGAIIVRTKHGTVGKTRIRYSGQFAVNDAISHSKTMSAYDFGIWHNRFLKADNRDSDGRNLFSTEELEKMKNLNYDWLDEA